MKKILLIICAALLLTGCGGNSQAREAKVLNTIKISVGDKIFSATLEDNPTAKKFSERLPLEAEMTELNGNEKYFYLDDDLPNEPASVKQIHAGDVMLFGSNCVVLFYKNFSTSYSYTRIGRIENPADLEKILGAGNVRVKFADK